jgi:hypothetical protein
MSRLINIFRIRSISRDEMKWVSVMERSNARMAWCPTERILFSWNGVWPFGPNALRSRAVVYNNKCRTVLNYFV